MTTLTAVALLASALIQSDPATAVFTGHFRATPKTTMLGEAPETFNSVADIRNTLLKDDATMRSTYGDMAALDRQIEEHHVVRVPAFILAVKFEDHSKSSSGDNDFHVIIGDSPTSLLNAEVSGLPPGGDPGDRFLTVRKELLAILAAHSLQVSNRFQKPDPPIKVQVTGSIYFDADHVAGAVGPQGLRPTTAWEIHPIQDIREVGQ